MVEIKMTKHSDNQIEISTYYDYNKAFKAFLDNYKTSDELYLEVHDDKPLMSFKKPGR